MRFTTDFPGGNGKLLAATEYDWGWEIVFLAECKAGEPMPLWFNFRLEELTGTKVRLKLANSRHCLGNPWEWDRNRPVARQAGGDWKRVATAESGLACNQTLDTWFEVALKGDRLDFAFFFPYQLSDLLATVDQTGNVFEKTVIGYSNRARPIYRLSSDFGGTETKKPGIYVIGRQHAGEATGSWVIDGMLRRLASEEGRALREKFTWWFVPIIDMDGVEEGFYGKDQIHNDLNRAWGPGASRRVEVTAVRHDLEQFMRCSDAKFMFDMHAPGHAERESYFFIKAEFSETHREELRRIWSLFNGHLKENGFQEVRFHETQAGSSTSVQSGMTAALYAHQIGLNGCTFEISYQGEHDRTRSYTMDDYRALGAHLVETLAEVYG